MALHRGKWIVLAMVIVSLVLFGATGCGSDDTASSGSTAAAPSTQASAGTTTTVAADSGPKKIGFVSICAVCTGEARAVSGMKDAAKAAGWEITTVDGAGDFQKIISTMETFINEGDDAIVLGAIDPAPLGDAIAKANAAGVPVIAESGLWVPGVTLQVGQDSYKMGTIQGTYMADRLGNEGNVMMLTYRPTRNVAMREDVVKLILNDAGIKVVNRHEVDLNNIVDDSRKAVETQLLADPNLDAIWCGWDDMCTGAAAAVSAAGRDDIFMIGNDAGAEALEKIRDPKSPWDVTVQVDYETIGKTIIEQLGLIFDGQKPAWHNIFVELPVITRDNVPAEGESLPSVTTYTPATAR